MWLIEARVAGIPCQINVTSLEPFRPGRYSGAPEDCYPDEGGDVEYEILDRRGRTAPWLERKVTEKEHERILDTIFEDMHKHHHF